MTIPAYPLQWPAGWPRARSRTDARFLKNGKQLSIFDGVTRVRQELERMGIKDEDIVISTAAPLRLDGWPRGDVSVSDCGAAVYWRTGKGDTKVMAIDRYYRLADNLAAIAATLEAMRSIERHGGAQILDRAFTGFTALPAPGAKKEWHEVLCVEAHTSTAEVREAYRRLSMQAHPDRPGGSHDRMAEINAAWHEFQTERGL